MGDVGGDEGACPLGYGVSLAEFQRISMCVISLTFLMLALWAVASEFVCCWCFADVNRTRPRWGEEMIARLKSISTHCLLFVLS